MGVMLGKKIHIQGRSRLKVRGALYNGQGFGADEKGPTFTVQKPNFRVLEWSESYKIGVGPKAPG